MVSFNKLMYFCSCNKPTNILAYEINWKIFLKTKTKRNENIKILFASFEPVFGYSIN